MNYGTRYLSRLPMGSIIIQDVFQRKLDAIFLSVPGVTGKADDMIIYGKTDHEHDGNLLNFLEVCRKNNLTLNPDKCSSDFRKFPSLDTLGAIRDYQLTQRRLKP